MKSGIIKADDNFDIVILDSALKHGINEDRILSCLFNVRGDKLLDDPPPKRLLAGFDNLGNALELIAIEDEEQARFVVIHAMKLTKQYYFLLEGV
jgi:hypothetical protein